MYYKALSGIIYLCKNYIMFYDELIYISEVTKIEFPKLLLMQLIYEATSACIITQVNNNSVMLRTMDWDMPILKNLTVELEFVKDGKTIFVAPTWVGCVGTFIIHVPGKYTVAVNYRRTNKINFFTIIKNMYTTFMMSWPISYFVRNIAERGIEYDSVIEGLRSCNLISPCYITVFNPSGESCIITRNPRSSDISMMENSEFLIQTNRDDNTQMNNNNENIMYSIERYKLASSLIKKNNNNWNSKEKLAKDMFVHSIINYETVYRCIIDAYNIEPYI